jgi:hypothetical protein
MIVLYFAVTIWTGVKSGDFFAMLLSGTTYVPLMLLFFSPLLIVLGIIIGLALGCLTTFRGSVPSLWVGALLGMGGGVIVLKFVAPMIFNPHSGDFTSIVTNIYFSAAYGAVTGWIVNKLLRRIFPAVQNEA